jgi:hypothetical protein
MTHHRHHEITIHRKGEHAIPSHCPAMYIGDTARYTSPDGEVQVKFVKFVAAIDSQPVSPPTAPFEGAVITPGEAVITGSALQTVTTGGSFEVRCFVKEPGELDFKGWDETKSPQSGGHFPVLPNNP